MSRLMGIVIVLTGAHLAARHCAAADSAASAEPASSETATVEQVLRGEADARGAPLDRRRLLAEILDQSPDLAAARWQAGYVRHDGRWITFEEVAQSGTDAALWRAYCELREATPQRTDDQLRLADWCRKHELRGPERAHLATALVLSGGRELPGIRQRLGDLRVGDRWMTADEQAHIERAAREAEESLRTWGPTLWGIARRLLGPPRQRKAAVAELERIDDPAALPAIEVVLTAAGEVPARQAVRYFARIDRYQSSLALARQAVFSPWPSVRAAAVAALTSRPLDEFAPSLLMAMHRPAAAAFQVAIGGRGELLYNYTAAREMADHWQVARTSVRTAGVPPQRTIRNSLGVASALSDRRVENDMLRAVQDDLHHRERLLSWQNEQTERLNTQIGTVLSDVSGQPATSEPDDWWDWWIDELDIEEPGKRVVIVSENDRILPRPQGTSLLLRPMSCFAAGTLIWTHRGSVPVERIQVGDLVLAKEIETGELSYKPVLLTTVRQAPRILRLTVEGERMQLTSGHPLWVSGSGWTRARYLRPGMHLHTVTGTARVESIEPAEAGPVFNLVVADAHTYFCGRARILSHDPTIPRLTDATVPGLAP